MKGFRFRNILFVCTIMMTVIYFLLMFNDYRTLEKSTYTRQLETEVPLVIAHRGGAELAPENTLQAFEIAQRVGADVIELDVHLSKDQQLIVIHDQSVDRTTNGKGRVDQLTLKELKELDAGYTFKSIDGEYSFRGKGIQIPTLEEVFQAFPEMPLIIEIKDKYPKRGRSIIEKKVWKLIKKYKREEDVIVFSFQEDIIQRFNRFAKGRVAIGASSEEAKRFILLHKLYLHNLYRPSSHVFILPPKRNHIYLADKRLIRGSHHHNMFIHYWTINDEKQMKELLKKGADGIITDRPDLLVSVIDKMKQER